MAVKFPLEMKNGIKARTMKDLVDNFDTEKVVGYFLDGKLKKWLDARWYEDEAEKIAELDKNDPKLAKHLCEIFGVEYEEEEIDPEEIARRNERIAKLKQYTDDEEIIKNIDSVAFNQEELADLYDRDVKKIYLCKGDFRIPKSKSNLEYVVIAKANVEGAFKKQDVEKADTKPDTTYIPPQTSGIPSELADLIVGSVYAELKDYVVWTGDSGAFVHQKTHYQEFFKNKNAGDMRRRFKVWNKKTDEYFSFDIPSAEFDEDEEVEAIYSYENTILIKDGYGHRYFYDVDSRKEEYLDEEIYLEQDDSYFIDEYNNEYEFVLDSKELLCFDDESEPVLLNMDTKELKETRCCIDRYNDGTVYHNGDYIFYIDESKNFINVYDIKTHKTKAINIFGNYEDLSNAKMVWYSDELFIFYGSDVKKLIGVKLDGTATEYLEVSNAERMYMFYDTKVQNKSKYLIFNNIKNNGNNDFYIFNMKLKTIKTHNSCINNKHNKSTAVGMTSFLSFEFLLTRALGLSKKTIVVGNYLYDFSDQSKVYRVDITKEWDPVLISKSE